MAFLGVAKGDAKALQALSMRELLRANREIARQGTRRFSPTLDNTVFDGHVWDPVAPAVSADVPMMIGTCRTELSNQLGNSDPTTFEITDAELPVRLARFVPAADVPRLLEVFRQESPNATAPELFFKVTTARGYWRDSVLQTERKAAQGGAPVWSYRLMWRTPVEDGRRITPHSLDLPFMFDNVSKAAHMVGPASPETDAMAEAMSESWLAFARTGDPNNPAVPDWRPYDLDRRMVMLFDTPSRVEEDPHRAERLAMEAYPTQQLGGTLHRQAD
jgi:para-nitrobenzyl esterase